jgi:hypothetical protein
LLQVYLITINKVDGFYTELIEVGADRNDLKILRSQCHGVRKLIEFRGAEMAEATNAEAAGILAQFIEQLTGLQTSAQGAPVDGRSLQQEFLQAQQLYQTQLLPALMDTPTAERFQSYQTEINRALRLLGMDVAFLQSAKNAMTIQKRQAQMQQQLKTLLEFCQGLQTAMAE